MGSLSRDEINKIRVLIGRDPLPAVDCAADQAPCRRKPCTTICQATVSPRSTHRDHQPEDLWVPNLAECRPPPSIGKESRPPYEFGLPLSPVLESAELSASPSSSENVLDARLNSEQHSPSTGPTDPGSDGSENSEDQEGQDMDEKEAHDRNIKRMVRTPRTRRRSGKDSPPDDLGSEEESVEPIPTHLATRSTPQKRHGSDGTCSTPLSGSSDTEIGNEEEVGRITHNASTTRWEQVAVNF